MNKPLSYGLFGAAALALIVAIFADSGRKADADPHVETTAQAPVTVDDTGDDHAAADAAEATPGLAFAEMTDADRAVFGEEVRAYLLEHPEVIMEAVAVLERRDAAQQVANDAALVATNHDALFNDPMSHVGGNPDGDITFVEFVDYKCGYCRKAFPEVKALVEDDGNIRIIYKEFPILGEESLLASRFAVSAKLIGGDAAYGEVHDAMMTMRGNVSEDSLVALAEGLDLDGEAILDGISDPSVDAALGENHALAARLQISGTPTFVIGDQLVRGYVPSDTMAQMVAELRAAEAH